MLTIITSDKTLSKRYQLKGNKLVKSVAAQMTTGTAEVRKVNSLAELSDVLVGLNTNQALTYGVPPEPSCRILSRKEYQEQGAPKGCYTRTNSHFTWPAGPGIKFNDYDPQGQALSQADLVKAIREAVPGLEGAGMLAWTSASSHICLKEKDLTGAKGQRIYMLVADASDIPRASAAIQTYLWAAGHGRVEISKSGALLLRTILDASVHQASRLDFAAGAECEPPLEQRRPAPIVIPGTEVVDTKAAIPDPDPETVLKAQAAMEAAKEAARPKSEAVKDQWIEEQVKDVPEQDRDRARSTARRAVEKSILSGDFLIHMANGDVLTVGEILDHPDRYHGAQTRDPLEPGYHNNKTCARIYIYGGSPVLHSQAHGGRTFRLRRQPRRISCNGDSHGIVESVLDIARNEPDIYDMGELMVMVNDDDPQPTVLEPDLCFHDLGGRIEFYTVKKDVEITIDPPVRVIKSLVALGRHRKLKKLNAVITAPTVRPDFSLLNRPGYDPETGILLAMREELDVPVCPDIFDVVGAVKALMKPFDLFPYADKTDRSNMLTALLTAAIRPVIPTAPAFGFTAPDPGSGKTLLAKCVARFNTGRDPVIVPHQHGRDDEETRKRLFAHLLSGETALVWDNINGVFNSTAMAAFITSAQYRDRILGKSQMITIPNRTLMLLNGNHLTLAGDMPRRVIPININAKTERPAIREFDFCPEALVKEQRLEMVRNALIIILGFKNLAEGRAAPGRMASFEMWDEIIRQPICWLAAEVLPDDFVDPMDAVTNAVSNDPERESLGEMLRIWFDLYQDKAVTAAQIVKDTNDVFGSTDFRDILSDVVGGRNLTAKTLGKILRYRMERIVDGLVLQKFGTAQRSILWRVKPV